MLIVQIKLKYLLHLQSLHYKQYKKIKELFFQYLKLMWSSKVTYIIECQMKFQHVSNVLLLSYSLTKAKISTSIRVGTIYLSAAAIGCLNKWVRPKSVRHSMTSYIESTIMNIVYFIYYIFYYYFISFILHIYTHTFQNLSINIYQHTADLWKHNQSSASLRLHYLYC